MNKDNCCNNQHEEHNCGCEGHEHNHDHDCGCHDNDHDCGCHDHHHDHEEMEMIQLTLDDDTVMNCFVIGIFEVDDKEYIALLPEDDERVILYQYNENDGEVELKTIEDDEEFDVVSEAYYELFSDEEE